MPGGKKSKAKTKAKPDEAAASAPDEDASTVNRLLREIEALCAAEARWTTDERLADADRELPAEKDRCFAPSEPRSSPRGRRARRAKSADWPTWPIKKK